MAFINPKKAGAYVLTPNGSSIAHDESNVGQQMLKKMGWTPDTGLGKDNSGIVDPIKVKDNIFYSSLGFLQLRTKRSRQGPYTVINRYGSTISLQCCPAISQ